MKKLIKKDFLIPLFILLFFIHANFISAFGFEFQIQTTSPNENFNWGIYDASNITVNWGDSASNETLNGSYVFANHSYSVADTYNISLIGNATRISFYNGTEDSLINILTPISNGLDGITSGYEMFRDAKNITNFTTENFFDETSSNVTNMWSMFRDATNFNGNISNWNISKISDTWYMFAYAISFNQNLTNWDTSKVINMDHMFYNATSFNGNISNWNTSSVTDMNNMFYNATSFNQDLSNWDVSSVTNMDNMFYNATLDTEIYDEILINWANLSSLKNNTPFHAGNSKYSSSASDKRNYIITNYNWTITDGGLYFSGEETPVPSSSGGGGGSGGGGSTIPTIIFSKEQFEKGYSANLAVGSRFEVNVENKEHHVMLNEMTSLTASITISSEPQNATLVVGESKKFEVNEDNYYDLLVTLNSIDLEKNLVNLTLKYIHEEIFNKEILNNQSSVEEGNISGEERLYEEGKKIRISFGFYFIFAVILIIGIVLLIKFKKFKKWKKQK